VILLLNILLQAQENQILIFRHWEIKTKALSWVKPQFMGSAKSLTRKLCPSLLLVSARYSQNCKKRQQIARLRLDFPSELRDHPGYGWFHRHGRILPGRTQMQVGGAYANLPGSQFIYLSFSITNPAEGSLVSGNVLITANPIGTVTVNEVEFFVNGNSIGVDTNGTDDWSILWNTTTGLDGDYTLTAVARGGGLTATSTAMTVTVNNSGQPQPTVTLIADQLTVVEGESSTLSWSSTNADSCEANGSWSGPRMTSGSESTGALMVTTSYTLTCSGLGGSTVSPPSPSNKKTYVTPASSASC
jgi:hypothetical protein